MSGEERKPTPAQHGAELGADLGADLGAEPGADAEDATVAVPRPVADDQTVVVPRPAAEDATVAVPRPAPAADATVVVPRPEPARHTDSRHHASARLSSSESFRRSRTGGTTSSRNPAPPVEEPEQLNVSRDIAALMFKSPLDPRRRARESPFPESASSKPRQGVRPGMPVVYGARSDSSLAVGVAASPSGPISAGQPVVPREGRASLPSTARRNRREQVITLAGGAGMLVAVAFGLWWIGSLALA
ncbi:hypothetical protein [Leucobacter luti]|uniref:hypothetical protein n=1 Tax=Leucobacter luti TaxID=340320 RepID=UPI003D04895F